MASMLQDILLTILGPLILMMGLGAVLHRKFTLDIASLARLNIYLFVPAFVFNHVSQSTLPWADMGGIVGITLLQVFSLGVIVWGIGQVLNVDRATLAPIALSVMFYNSANYGLPLVELAYGPEGAAVQTFVVTTQNLLTFTVGMLIAAWAGTGKFGQGFLRVLRTPVLPTLAAALLTRWWIDGRADEQLPQMLRMVSKTASFLSAGLVPIALVTLGAQLASNPRWPRWRPVSLVLGLRLLFGPAWMAAMLYGFHKMQVPGLDLWPRPAEFLILTAGTPTAINTLLLTIEMGGDPELSADCVFWTTIASLLTVTFWVALLRIQMGP
jgi:malate permease and related proteins